MAFRCLAVLAAATTVLAKTPAGFTPSSQTDLIVEYNGFVPLNGAEASKNVTASRPRIGTLSRLNGTSYAVMMVDLDVPTDTPPATDTLLHWMQAGLVPSATPTQMNTTAGTLQVFLLGDPSASNTGTSAGRGRVANATAGITVPYVGPNPPARTPLSHRYVQLLVDTSGMTAQGAEALRRAAASATTTTRRGFDPSAALAAAGLGGRVVAGNSFNVTNAGPPANSTGGSGPKSGSGSASESDTSGSDGSASRAGAGDGARQTVLPGEGVGSRPGSVLIGGLVAVGVVALGL